MKPVRDDSDEINRGAQADGFERLFSKNPSVPLPDVATTHASKGMRTRFMNWLREHTFPIVASAAINTIGAAGIAVTTQPVPDADRISNEIAYVDREINSQFSVEELDSLSSSERVFKREEALLLTLKPYSEVHVIMAYARQQYFFLVEEIKQFAKNHTEVETIEYLTSYLGVADDAQGLMSILLTEAKGNCAARNLLSGLVLSEVYPNIKVTSQSVYARNSQGQLVPHVRTVVIVGDTKIAVERRGIDTEATFDDNSEFIDFSDVVKGKIPHKPETSLKVIEGEVEAPTAPGYHTAIHFPALSGIDESINVATDNAVSEEEVKERSAKLNSLGTMKVAFFDTVDDIRDFGSEDTQKTKTAREIFNEELTDYGAYTSGAEIKAEDVSVFSNPEVTDSVSIAAGRLYKSAVDELKKNRSDSIAVMFDTVDDETLFAGIGEIAGGVKKEFKLVVPQLSPKAAAYFVSGLRMSGVVGRNNSLIINVFNSLTASEFAHFALIKGTLGLTIPKDSEVVVLLADFVKTSQATKLVLEGFNFDLGVIDEFAHSKSLTSVQLINSNGIYRDGFDYRIRRFSHVNHLYTENGVILIKH